MVFIKRWMLSYCNLSDECANSNIKPNIVFMAKSKYVFVMEL